MYLPVPRAVHSIDMFYLTISPKPRYLLYYYIWQMQVLNVRIWKAGTGDI